MRRLALRWSGTLFTGSAAYTVKPLHTAQKPPRRGFGHDASEGAAARLDRIFARAPRLQPPLPPLSISGAPFPYLLHATLIEQVAVHRQRLAEALEHLLYVATVTKDGLAGTGEAGAGAAATSREKAMWKALLVLQREQQARLSELNPRRITDVAVELRRPLGHVRVALIVGLVYLQLRHLGVDVDDWWARYYRAFVAPKSGLLRDGISTVDSASGAGCGVVPPFYWHHVQRCRQGKKVDEEWRVDDGVVAAQDGEGPESQECVFVTPLQVLCKSGAAPAPRTAQTSAASWRTIPASRASVWVPLGLLCHLPFFPIPYPTQLPASGTLAAMASSVVIPAATDVGKPPGGEALGASLASANHSGRGAALDQEGEDAEVTEWASATDLDGDEGSGQATAAHDAAPPVAYTLAEGSGIGGVASADCWSSMWGQSASGVGDREEAAATTAARDGRGWAHPFFDTLHLSARTVCNKHGDLNAIEPLDSTSSSEASHRHAYLEWLRLCRAEEARRPGLRVEATGASAVASQGENVAAKRSADVWPPPLLHCDLRPTLWPLLSRFWAAKSDMAANLPCLYFFPCQSYPALHLQRLMRARQRFSDGRLDRFHLKRFPSSFRTKLWRCNDGDDDNNAANPGKRRPRQRRRLYSDAMSRRGGGAAVPDARGASGTVWGTSSAITAAELLTDKRYIFPRRGLLCASYFGMRYTCVETTELGCLFDSNTCVEHAIPLGETGDILFRVIHDVRYRLQHSCSADPPSVCRGSHGPPAELRSGSIHRNPSQQRREPYWSGCGAGGGVAQADSDERPVRKTSVPYFEAAMKRLECLEMVAQPVAGQRDACAAPTKDEASAADVAALSVSPWANRLREIRTQCASGYYAPDLTHMERIIEMQTVQRNLCFLFHSPYWIEAAAVFERWGVRVAPGVIPLRIAGADFVNAEQTTDASRFNPRTCVPHLSQQVLCASGLVTCSWDASQDLLAVLTPDVAPRTRRGGVQAWSHAGLLERAAAAQRVPNLWITVSVLARFGWSVRPAPQGCDSTGHGRRPSVVRATVPVRDLLSTSVRALVSEGAMAEVEVPTESSTDTSPGRSPGRDVKNLSYHSTTAPIATAGVSLFSPPSHPDSPPTPGPHAYGGRAATVAVPRSVAASPSLAVVHSSCVAEQDELLFAAAYAPLVLVSRLPDFSPSDWGYQEYMALKQRRHAEGGTASTGMDMQAATHLSGDDNSEADADREEDEEREGEGDGDVAHPDDEDGEERTTHEPVAFLYRAAMRRKCQAERHQWRAVRLRFSSRLDMAQLALQKGYHKSLTGRRWVLADVLRTEPLLRPAAGGLPERSTRAVQAAAAEASSLSPAGITAIQVELEYFEGTKHGSGLPAADPDGVMSEGKSPTGPQQPSYGDGYDGLARRFAIVTVINATELTWPVSSTAHTQQRWVWKRF